MAPRKAAAPPEPRPEPIPVQLEPPDERIRLIMSKWGAATETAIEELSFAGPGWAAYLKDVYDLFDSVLGGE